ncbi:hypothetical protein C8F01DRAFT_1328790 [Mycena amicta]|nr:hypothetical protein C8F01DRAFT_1328790 [Mycena amicta]
MSEAPPLKRRREDDNDPPAAIVRSPDYWFDDGSIILQVQTTQFRVAKSMLAMHSTVFRDMFTMPLPPDEPLVDTCPVVVLSGDTAEDWEHLLAAMYTKSCYPEEAKDISVLSALLRLSKKYDIPVFRRECLFRFKAQFPTTLEGYDESSGWTYIVPAEQDDQTVVAAVNLAREIQVFSILPYAFYLIEWRSVSDLSVLLNLLNLT